MNTDKSSPFVFIEDITNGLENIQISFVNQIDFETFYNNVTVSFGFFMFDLRL